MIKHVSRPEYHYLAAFLEDSCGIHLGDTREYLVETRLGAVLDAHGLENFTALVSAMQRRVPNLREEVMEAMTTGETSWFRDTHPFEILRKQVLARHVRDHSAFPLRVWCAGCATGQEAYSAVITVLEFAAEHGRPVQLQVLATDISARALAVGRRALYSGRELERGLSESRRARYFRPQGENTWRPVAEVTRPVGFVRHNLLDEPPEANYFDAILCRNVLIYFTAEYRRALVEKLHRALAPGGVLICGASESIAEAPRSLSRHSDEGGIYFQRSA